MRGLDPGVGAKVEEPSLEIPEVEEAQEVEEVEEAQPIPEAEDPSQGAEEPSQEKPEAEQVVEESQEPEQTAQDQEPQAQEKVALEGTVTQAKDWASMSKNDLIEEAKSAGLKVKVTTSKTELIELLNQNG